MGSEENLNKFKELFDIDSNDTKSILEEKFKEDFNSQADNISEDISNIISKDKKEDKEEDDFDRLPEMEPVVEPVVEPVKEGNLRVVAGNPDEKVINGKLFKSVGYMENGCSKYKLEEVK